MCGLFLSHPLTVFDLWMLYSFKNVELLIIFIVKLSILKQNPFSRNNQMLRDVIRIYIRIDIFVYLFKENSASSQ